jgi:uncharacterized protein (TIGR03437 family)
MYIGVGVAPVLSSDGRSVIYLARSHAGAPVQAWLGRTDRSQLRRLTALAENAVSATLSGHGNAAFVSTDTGRLLRIDVPSGVVRELIPRTPLIASGAGAAVPGSLHWIYGNGLGDVTTVELGTLEAPILYREETTIAFQIPFEAPLAPLPLHLASNASPLEPAPVIVSLQSVDPQFIRTGEKEVAAIHQDFRAIVTASDPATPGEILHFYMTGLGAVDPPVPTGSPAPAGQIVRTRDALDCRWWDGGKVTPAEVLFAGLAPGWTGIYQVSARAPEPAKPSSQNDASLTWITIECGARETGTTAGIPIRPGP